MKENKKVWILIGSFLAFLVGYNVYTNVYAENNNREKDEGYILVHSLGHELVRIDNIFTQVLQSGEVTSDLATQLVRSSEQMEFQTRLIALYLEEEPNELVKVTFDNLIVFTNKMATEASKETILLNRSQKEALEILRQEISALTINLEPAKSLEAELNNGFHPKEALETYIEHLETYTHWHFLDGNAISHPLIEN